MPNPLYQFGISDAELAAAIAADADVNAGLRDKCEEVVEYWRSVSPVDEGDYAASVGVIGDVENGRAKVGSTHWKAHMIEHGTGDDSKGGTRYVPAVGRRVGPSTPTPEFAPGAKTAAKFGGTLAGNGDESSQ